MRRVLLAAAFLAGCGGGGSGDDDVPDGAPPPPPDAGMPPDAMGPVCLTANQRNQDCQVDVSGQIVDFVTQARPMPLSGAQLVVSFTTAWDTIPLFPLGCDPLATIPVDAMGMYAMVDAPCDSPQHPPIALSLVDDAAGASDDWAPTASDHRLTCAAAPPSDCGSLVETIPVPSAALAAAWRTELLAGGMANADTRGLVLYQFLDDTGAPAAGVTPFMIDGPSMRPLTPGTEVRFLDVDRITLLAANTTTSPSGVAVIGLGGDVAFVGGTRADGYGWTAQGVLFANGWLFVEDNSVDTLP